MANKNFDSETITYYSKPVKSLGIEIDLTFFVLPGLQSFDGIIGDDTFRQLEVVTHRQEKQYTQIGIGSKIQLKSRISKQDNCMEKI